MWKSSIPKFESVQEEAVFWDTHDITDFEDECEVVDEEIHFVVVRRDGSLGVRLDHDDLHALAERAIEEGTTPPKLARQWIVERLHAPRGERADISEAP